MKNDYEIRGEITAIFLTRKNGAILETIIDTSDLENAHHFKGTWYARWNRETNAFYVDGHIRNKNKDDKVQLHRWLTNAEKDIQVDHIFHDTLDNRRNNLRMATIKQNAQNRKGPQRNSKSGIRGVCWNAEKNKWRSYVTVNKKQSHIGYFDDRIVAEEAVKEARKMKMPFSQEALVNKMGAFSMKAGEAFASYFSVHG